MAPLLMYLPMRDNNKGMCVHAGILNVFLVDEVRDDPNTTIIGP